MNSNPLGDRGGQAWGRLAVKVAVSVALMAFLMRRISIDELLRATSSMNPAWFVASAVCFLVSNVVGAWQWHRLLDASGVPISFAASFRYYFVGLFFNNFLPANIGGDAVKVYDVTRAGSSVYQVVAVTLLDRLLGIFSLCALAAIAALAVMKEVSFLPYGYYFVVFVGCMIPAVGLYFVRPLGNILRSLVAKVRRMSIDVRLTAVLNHLGAFKARRGLMAQLTLVSIFIQALRVLTHVLVAKALGIEIGTVLFCQFFVFVPLLSLAMIPPITINGLGIREGLGIVLFAAAGIGRSEAFVLEFLTYVVSVAVSLLGFLFFVSRRERRGASAAN